MSVEIKLPEISALRLTVEKRFGKAPEVHFDFESLAEDIYAATKKRISETTLERLWGYSTRTACNVSLHTLDVLCLYIGEESWKNYCTGLANENNIESCYFDCNEVKSDELEVGQKLRIGWLPNRKCIIKYLGTNRFITEESQNAKMKPGDTFSCLAFKLHQPLFLENFHSEGEENSGAKSYGIGLKNGLTMLQKLV